MYVLQVNVGLLVFYLLYRGLLARDTFLGMRRLYWWAAWVLAFLYPLVELGVWGRTETPLQVVMADYAEVMTVVVSAVAPEEAATWSWQDGLALLWAAGASALLLRMLVQLAVVCRLARRGRKVEWHGVRVLAVEGDNVPFSFFRWIFVQPGNHSEGELEEILAHEQAHVRQWHSLDVVVSELLCCLFWFNPAVWLAKRCVRQNLEFLADRAVVHSGFDRKNYQYHLLRLSYGVNIGQIVNNFNVSPLKKRIMMMNKKKSRHAGALKYALLLPVAGLLVLSANAEAVAETAENVVAHWTADDGQVRMTGVVVDENGKPLPGVTVVIKGSMLGVATDAEGRFEIVSPEGKTLVFTYVGRKSQEVAFDAGTTDIKVVMPVENVELDAVKFMDNEIQMNGVKTVGDEKDRSYWEGVPTFPEGDVQEYIAQHLRYPEEALKNKWEGTVEVAFSLDTTGKVVRTEIFRGINPVLDAEALRVIREMPAWRPGKYHGNPTRVMFKLPVTFILPENRSSVSIASDETVGEGELGKTTVTLNHVTKETLAYLMGKKAPRSLGGAERELFDQLREKEGNLFVLIKGHGEQPTGFDLRTLNPDSIDMITVTLSEEVLTSYGKREKAKAMVVVDLKNLSDDGGGVLKEVGAGEGLNDRMAGTGKEGNTVVEQGEVYKVVEDFPRFPEGNVQQYIAWNLHYPEKALKDKVEGKVFVQFVIDTTGKVVEPKVIKSVSPELDAEALRVVSEMPAWKPGMQRGKPVRVSFTLPVIFKLPAPEGTIPSNKVQVSTMVADSIFIVENSVTGSGNPKGEAYKSELSELRSKIKETPLIFVNMKQQEAGFDLASLDPQMVERVMLCWGTRIVYMDGQKLDNQTVVMVKMKEGK